MARRFTWLLPAALLAAGTAAAGDATATQPVTVFAAASLTDVLQKLGDDFTRASGVPVRFSFASSAALARQIESGAGADVFVSADAQWMDYLEQRGRIRAASRRDLVGNRLVLIAPSDSRIELRIAHGFPLLQALRGGRLAVADPDSVPAGRYARQALAALGAWSEVADRLVRAEDVRHALIFVARGESPLGIVYRTDALVEKRVRIVDSFPDGSHAPIRYPVAVTADALPAASRFVDFLGGAAARAAFEDFGFVVLR